MSRHSYDDANAKCPYYMEQSATAIKCEGVGARGSITLAFPTKIEKGKWTSRYCNRYPECQFCVVYKVKSIE